MDNTHPIFTTGEEPMKLVVFISGSGTNLRALCKEELKIRETEKARWEIPLVFTNVKVCGGIDIANSFKKNLLTLSSKKYFETLGINPDDDESRIYYDAAVISLIEQYIIPDLIVLAGYRRKLSELFYSRYSNRILNMYPGDITKSYLLRGIDASLQAINNHEDSIKATVYFDQPGTRFGTALLQSEPIYLEGYSAEDIDLINNRIRKEAEWKILPFAISHLIAAGNITVDEENRLYYKNKEIPANGLQLKDLTEYMI